MVARWMAALVLVTSAGVGCGGSFSAGDMDASVEDVGDDAPERTILVIPAGDSAADGQGDDAGLDATFAEDVASIDAVDAWADASDERSTCSCTTPHADTSACNVDGACVETRCTAGYLDCDGDPTNGCETEFSTLNCGACGKYCNPSNVNRATCANYALGCSYNSCATGYLDCDGDLSNGCETPFSPAHCGRCDTACQPAHVVSASCFTSGLTGGQCSYTQCAPFDTMGNLYLDCDNNVANGCESSPNTDANCGSCGNACTGGVHCSLVSGASVYGCQ